MQTRMIRMDSEIIDIEKMQEAAALIRDGELVAFPTETVYGLGADALRPEASAKIYEAKGRKNPEWEKWTRAHAGFSPGPVSHLYSIASPG